MAAPTGTAPIARALVQALRGNPTLKSGLPGGFHEGVAPIDAEYPWLVYQLAYGPMDYAFGSMLIPAGFDIIVFGRDQVEARNLDSLVNQTLHDAELSVEGQSMLFSRRLADLSSAEVDEEGLKVYGVGGTYEFWTDQTL